MTEKEIVRALRCISTVCNATDRNCPDCGYFRKWFGCDVDRLSKDAADAIERLTAENAALREKQQWIPVTERLPECAVPVLVSYIGFNSGELHADDVAARIDDRWMWWDGDLQSSDERVIVKITHWMPLPAAPEAPEGGDNNGKTDV